MADRYDDRGGWNGGGSDRWRNEHDRGGRGRDDSSGGEGRSFRGGHGEGEHEPWRRDRYGSLYDQDRTNYGSGWDAERGDYGRGMQDRGGDSFDRERSNWNRGEDVGYGTRGGQGNDRGRPSGGGRGDMEFRQGGRGYGAYGGHEPHDDHRRWPDEPRMHDRDYESRGDGRHGGYDAGYADERRRSAGTAHWQDQGGSAGTNNRNYITPESHDYGARLYNEVSDRPSGRLDFRGGGGGGGGGGGYAPQRSSGGRGGFMDTSPQVRAASEGWGGRGDAEDYDRHWRERDHEVSERDRRRGRWDRDRDR